MSATRVSAPRNCQSSALATGLRGRDPASPGSAGINTREIIPIIPVIHGTRGLQIMLSRMENWSEKSN